MLDQFIGAVCLFGAGLSLGLAWHFAWLAAEMQDGWVWHLSQALRDRMGGDDACG